MACLTYRVKGAAGGPATGSVQARVLVSVARGSVNRKLMPLPLGQGGSAFTSVLVVTAPVIPLAWPAPLKKRLNGGFPSVDSVMSPLELNVPFDTFATGPSGLGRPE